MRGSLFSEIINGRNMVLGLALAGLVSGSFITPMTLEAASRSGKSSSRQSQRGKGSSRQSQRGKGSSRQNQPSQSPSDYHKDSHQNQGPHPGYYQPHAHVTEDGLVAPIHSGFSGKSTMLQGAAHNNGWSTFKNSAAEEAGKGVGSVVGAAVGVGAAKASQLLNTDQAANATVKTSEIAARSSEEITNRNNASSERIADKNSEAQRYMANSSVKSAQLHADATKSLYGGATAGGQQQESQQHPENGSSVSSVENNPYYYDGQHNQSYPATDNQQWYPSYRWGQGSWGPWYRS
ncbi:hypothetical protein [Pasteuria penetrans]|uniref:hypothetical protein n=1 Tax=Pasteuria penetrans TaxID=86005 RepID=UPI000FA5777E|nr:hypothetical protein [Pasteuria penetrans]